MLYYFAYGSNMSHEQMKRRCPGSRFIKKVYLENAKFVYDGESITWGDKAVANVISSEGSVVWGGLFEINEEHLSDLDIRYEGFPDSYGKGKVEVKDDENNVYKAWIYFRIGQKNGAPILKYQNKIKTGAKDCNLPEEYIKMNLE